MDEKDLELAIDVFLNGADMAVEDDRRDREGINITLKNLRKRGRASL